MKMFLLDTLDNLLRMCVSSSLMNVFLWVLHEAGVRDIPSLHHLREVQTSLQKSSGIPTTQHKSLKENVYSMNDPCTLVAMVSNTTLHRLLILHFNLGLDQSFSMRLHPSLFSDSTGWCDI